MPPACPRPAAVAAAVSPVPRKRPAHPSPPAAAEENPRTTGRISPVRRPMSAPPAKPAAAVRPARGRHASQDALRRRGGWRRPPAGATGIRRTAARTRRAPSRAEPSPSRACAAASTVRGIPPGGRRARKTSAATRCTRTSIGGVPGVSRRSANSRPRAASSAASRRCPASGPGKTTAMFPAPGGEQ